jgi:hypothetical protein
MHQLDINPYVLPNTTSWALRGLKYRGFKLDIEIKPADATVTLKSIPQNDGDRQLYITSDGPSRRMAVDEPITFTRTSTTLKAVRCDASVTSCPGDVANGARICGDVRTYAIILLIMCVIAIFFNEKV